MLAQYGTRRVDGTHSRNYVCYWHMARLKMRTVEGREKCYLPLIPAELLEWQVFYFELICHHENILQMLHRPEAPAPREEPQLPAFTDFVVAWTWRRQDIW